MSTTEHAVRERQQLIGGMFAMEEFTERPLDHRAERNRPVPF